MQLVWRSKGLAVHYPQMIVGVVEPDWGSCDQVGGEAALEFEM